MNCPMCNGNIVEITGTLFFNSKPLGKIAVNGINYLKCQSCEDITINFETTKVIDSFIEAKELQAISSVPISDFVTLNEASEILGITKQAFSKNLRIKRGFIYSVVVGNSKLYHRNSVIEFKRTGRDGRIILNHPIIQIVEVPVHKYIFISIPEVRNTKYSGELTVHPRTHDIRLIPVHYDH